jgi:hypothetical protein
MVKDKQYTDCAGKNRGQFTEEFARQRFALVFGEERVLQGVNVFRSKNELLTDIDVLVLFGNRAIVVQAKSQKLTLLARRGNDGQIKEDFRKAIQHAYDQGYKAAVALLNPPAFKFCDNTGAVLQIRTPKEIFIITVDSEAYPALTFQARQFLHFQSTEAIRPPIVTDVFSIDALTEMLDSPVWLLDYLRRRSGYSDKLHTPDELTALSFHLKQNLWLEDKYDVVQLTDDISCDLDAAMTVRRDGIPGERIPDGILTRIAGTTIEGILRQIGANPEPAMLEFAFIILSCDEETVEKLSEGIDVACERFESDGRGHDFSMSIRSVPITGVIVHCNRNPIDEGWRNLSSHCEKRKYLRKAEKWYGICIDPHSKQLRFGVGLELPWKQDPAMEQRISALPDQDVPKVGRNELCPCGGGKKYKKCHGQGRS